MCFVGLVSSGHVKAYFLREKSQNYFEFYVPNINAASF